MHRRHISWAVAIAAATLLSAAPWAQEEKPVPKGSRRIAVTGCSKDYIFTAGGRPVEETRSSPVPPGTHLRMNGSKTVIADLKAREGTLIEITGLVKEGQFVDGVSVGGVRIRPGTTPTGGAGTPIGRASQQTFIDVEGWRAIGGDCPTR